MHSGGFNMRTSKDRTIEKKRRNKAMGAKRTEVSRARRVANKHKREEIHAIDPNLKVAIIDSKTFVDGNEIEIVDGKIKPVIINGIYELTEEKTNEMTKKYGKTFNIQDPSGKLNADYDEAVVEYQEVIDNDAVIEKIETRNKSAFRRLTDKLRRDQ